MSTIEKPIIAITMGDAAGIGPEIIVKALQSKYIHEICQPLVVGESGIRDELNGVAIEVVERLGDRRVAFARAIAHAPAILLADEPTASLDSAHGKQLIRLMVSLSRMQQCTLVVATHDPEVMEMADRRFPLKDGKMEETK